ncbi:hypothetical protein CsSME_00003950 [Camellia sinensis var. sinensis]
MPNWALKGCCDKDQKIFLITIAIFTVVIFAIHLQSLASIPVLSIFPLFSIV